jgi:hypothetical protein
MFQTTKTLLEHLKLLENMILHSMMFRKKVIQSMLLIDETPNGDTRTLLQQQSEQKHCFKMADVRYSIPWNRRKKKLFVHAAQAPT